MIVSAMSQAWRDRPGDIAVSQYRSRVGEMPKFKGNVWLLFHFHFHHFYLSIPSLASHGIQYPTNFHAEKFNLESEGWSFGGNGGCVFTFIISLPFKLDEIIKRNFQAGWRCRGTLGLAPARTFGLVAGFGDGCAR